MPELYARSPRKFEGNYGNTVPTLDFSNGVRVRDIAIDTSVSPYRIWLCRVNTIGAPVWEEEEQERSGQADVPDLDTTEVAIGVALSHRQWLLSYTLTGTGVFRDGVMRVGMDGSQVTVDDEYSGIAPAHALSVYGNLDGGVAKIVLDTTEGVGTALVFVYHIVSKTPS